MWILINSIIEKDDGNQRQQDDATELNFEKSERSSDSPREYDEKTGIV